MLKILNFFSDNKILSFFVSIAIAVPISFLLMKLHLEIKFFNHWSDVFIAVGIVGYFITRAKGKKLLRGQSVSPYFSRFYGAFQAVLITSAFVIFCRFLGLDSHSWFNEVTLKAILISSFYNFIHDVYEGVADKFIKENEKLKEV
jgi:hypothetical protein